jgi:tRNA(fMet)-specific endonuclease VapC
MTYLLDTNVVVTYLRGKDPLVKQRVDAQSPSDLRVCSVVLGELYYGAALSHQPGANATKVRNFTQALVSLPYDDRSSEEFGNLRAFLEKLGTPIGPYDLMIAAIALTNNVTLVTHNTAEFSRVPGLPLEDWQTP